MMPATKENLGFTIRLFPPATTVAEEVKSKEDGIAFLYVPHENGKVAAKPFFRKLTQYLARTRHNKEDVTIENFEEILNPSVDPDTRRKFFWHLCNLESEIYTDSHSFTNKRLKTWFRLEKEMDMLDGYEEQISKNTSEEIIINRITDNFKRLSIRRSDHGYAVKVNSIYAKHVFDAIRFILLLRAKFGKLKPFSGERTAEVLNDLNIPTAKNGVWEQSAVSKKYKQIIAYRNNFKSFPEVVNKFSRFRDKFIEKPYLYLREEVNKEKDFLSLLTSNEVVEEVEGKNKTRKSVPIKVCPLVSHPSEDHLKSILVLEKLSGEPLDDRLLILNICNNRGDLEYVSTIDFKNGKNSVEIDLWKDAMLEPGLYYVNIIDSDVSVAGKTRSSNKSTGFAPFFKNIHFGEELFMSEHLKYNDDLNKEGKVGRPIIKEYSPLRDQQAVIDDYQRNGLIPTVNNQQRLADLAAAQDVSA